MKTSTTLVVILAVVVGYFLSPPFVAYVYFGIDPTGSKHLWLLNAMTAFYGPSEALAEAFPPYLAYLQAAANAINLSP